MATEQDASQADETAGALLATVADVFKSFKPDDRSTKARAYAVCITELEKVYAYFAFFVLRRGPVADKGDE